MNRIIFNTLTVLFLFSCSSGDSDNSTLRKLEPNKTKEEVVMSQKKVALAKKIFSMMPSPVETAAILKESGIEFDNNLLYPTERAGEYNTSFQQAFVLGLYGTNLSYAGIFEQKQEFVEYFKTCKMLCDFLHIANAFNEQLVDDVEENIHNTDIILQLITDAFWTANTDLKDHNRQAISTLIIAGGWIEGLNLAVSIAENSDNALLHKRIGEQKYSLTNLFKLFNMDERNDLISKLRDDFRGLKEIFDSLEAETSKTKVKQKDGIMQIGGGSKLNITPEFIKAVSEETKRIRSKYVL